VSNYLNRIERESTRLNELIGQLLTLTRLESDNTRINMETVDLEGLMTQIVSDVDFEAVSSHKNVTIVKQEKVAITGNRELLHRTVENIVRNAVRYTHEKTAVELSLCTRKKDGLTWAVMKIRDHGPGVPEKELTNIFKPFYRVSDGRERDSGGVGVGLAISERAVRIHGGVISAANDKEGGLTVLIELPVTTT
jgi:two-component system sensor histidine kinase CpxA